LGANATVAGLIYAEKKAKHLSYTLDAGTFSWDEWVKPKSNKIGEVIQKYHDYRLKQSKISPSTFRTDYVRISKKLPLNENLELTVVLDAIAQTEPDSRVRKRLAEYCGRLCKFSGMKDEDIEKIYVMSGSYSASSVNPRDLPTDIEIATQVDKFRNSGYGWLLGVIAAYGIRSHEGFHIQILEFPKMKVLGGKTGERIIRPLYPEWAEKWELQNMRLPSLNVADNAELSTRTSVWFKRNTTFKALDLRHCYARRCFEFDIKPDRAAYMMGHSLAVHMKTYRAWFDEQVYDAVYERAINSENRPLPPST
jgi:hypothetical protein